MSMIVYTVCRLASDQSVEITNIGNQKVKESSRVSLMIENIIKIGGRIEEYNGDCVRVWGGYDSKIV